MQWNSASEFFAMGGYGFYVWSSFGLTGLAVIIEMLVVRHQSNEVLRNLRSELGSEQNSS